MRARAGCVTWRCGAWERVRKNPVVKWRVGVHGRNVGHVSYGTKPLRAAWGRMQSPMESRLPRMCRLGQDDLSGTFTNVIRAIFATAMQRAVVYAM